MKPTERDIQNAIYYWRSMIQPFPIMVTNTYLWHWESDLLYVSKNNYVTEFEIKVTHSDFLADAAKKTKHLSLQNGSRVLRHFYYACPESVIQPEELPEYAGLIWVSDKPFSIYTNWSKWYAREIKTAKRLNGQPLNEQQLRELLSKGVRRFWSLREHIENKKRWNK